MTWLLIPVVAVAAFMALGVAVKDDPVLVAKGEQRSIIDGCWRDYERKSADPQTKRLVASICESLEDDFAKQHGHRP